MIEEHEIAHMPYRTWRAACVRGRGRSNSHFLKGENPGTMPVISFDYGFFGSPGQDGEAGKSDSDVPVSIVHDRWSKSTFAHPVPQTRVARPWSAACLQRDIELLGYTRLILKGDQEPSIKSVVDAVARKKRD